MSGITWQSNGPIGAGGQNASITIDGQTQIMVSQGGPTLYWCTGSVILDGLVPQSIQFNLPFVPYDSGYVGRISEVNGFIAQVHMATVTTGSALWCGLGFGPPVSQSVVWQSQSFQQYDTGQNPDVSMNAYGNLVETHAAGTGLFPGALWARSGIVAKGLISWNGGNSYDTGMTPAISMNNNGAIVAVHSSVLGAAAKLYYNVGTWGNAIHLVPGGEYDKGEYPSVAINNNGQIVEVHNAPSSSRLYCHLGQLSADGNSVEWSPTASQFDEGYSPSVAINDQGAIVSVHQSNAAGGQLYYNVGYISQ